MQQDFNGIRKESYLCAECTQDIEMSMLIEGLFQGILLNGHVKNHHISHAAKAVKQCKTCGITLDYIRKTSLLGCASCYHTFGPELKHLIESTQKSTTHIGKIPKRGKLGLQNERNISKLRLHMKEAVELEDFARAAMLRDQIKRLEVDTQNV